MQFLKLMVTCRRKHSHSSGRQTERDRKSHRALTSVRVGVEGFASQEDQEMISRIEKQLKRRFAIGSQVSEHSIVQDFTKQVGVMERGVF